MREVGILTKESIIQACERRELVISPFERDRVQPTSYDIAVGAIAQGDAFVAFERIEVKRLDFVSFLSIEHIELPLDIVGHIFLRSAFARKGFGGIQLGRIEVGWRGRLVIEVVHAGTEGVPISCGESIATIEFSRLSRPAKEGYHGRFQGQ